MPYIVIDRAARPQLVVLETDDEDEALRVGESYANGCADCVVIGYEEDDVLDMSAAPARNNVISFASFASPEDAARAGFSPPSGDAGGPSGDGPEET